MGELIPARFEDLLRRFYGEVRASDSAFSLPRSKWHRPGAGDLDLSAQFLGRPVGNPSGPAAGPHTQMAQNLLLSYLAGGRVLELKTVQINDRLTIPRPCIDMTNVGYNVEWSQELTVEESAREYVTGMMLIEILRRDPFFAEESLQGRTGDVVFDMSVGYDLAGIRSDKIQRFLDTMRDASDIVESLRARIPVEMRLARGLDYTKQISSTLTLSTFHGCPASEIERICEFLIGERALDVIVKMNPPMLGKERLEHLLHDVLGYTELAVNPSAYASGLQFGEAVELVDRLTRFAQQRGRRFGCKFSNTLEVVNHRTYFTSDNKVHYLSGQPLHVITMTLTDAFRRAAGAEVPISFSAGIDRQNFPLAVACGFVPVTVCSDLLRPGGYGRLPPYLAMLSAAMKAVGATSLDDYILNAFAQRDAALALASKDGVAHDRAAAVRRTGLLNTTIAADRATKDIRYRADRNRKPPNRIDAQLRTFDCITCDKCIPVCPNAANFTYPTPIVAFDCHDWIIDPAGSVSVDTVTKHFAITESKQIANFADFCNECGNCDTFCPEHGGPYIKKPAFHGSLASWRRAAPRDGFFVLLDASASDLSTITGRIGSREYRLTHDPAAHRYQFEDDVVAIETNEIDHSAVACHALTPFSEPRALDIIAYHTMRNLLHGVLDTRHINQINLVTITPSPSPK